MKTLSLRDSVRERIGAHGPNLSIDGIEDRHDRDALKSEAKAVYDQARAEDRDLTDAEEKFINAALDQVERIDQGTAVGSGRKTPPIDPSTGKAVGRKADQPSTGAIGARSADLFGRSASDRGGFNSFGDFARGLAGGRADERLMPAAAATGHSGTVGADGGFLVPPAFIANLLDGSLESEIVRPRARGVPLNFGHARAAGFDTENRSSGIGGFSAEWLDEGQTMTAQKGLLRSLELKARKLGILTTATNELLSDSPFFQSDLQQILTSAIGFTFDEAFLTGSGAGQPTGVLNDPAIISVAKESGQTADTITFNNLKAMLNRLHPMSMNNAVWVASTSTREQLLSLVQFIRNEGDTDNVGGTWVPAMREGGDGQWRILGLPVLFTEKTPALGDEGDIILADFSQYIVALSSDATIRMDEGKYFDSDEVAFRVTMRADGMGRWSGPITPRNGGDTLSWAVTLAARA